MVTAAEANAMLPHSLALAGQIGSASIARGAGMDKNRAEGQRNKEDNDAALARLIKGKDLNAQEDKDKIQSRIAGLKQLQDSGMVPDGGSAGVEGVTIGKDPTLAIMAGQQKSQANEGAKLQQYAGKTLGPLKAQADALETMKQLIENPNSVNDQQLAVAQARLAEGPGQRLLQSVIEKSGASHTGAGGLVDLQNWARGGGMSKLQPGQVQAMQDNLQQHVKQLQQQAADAGSQYHAQAAFIAPHLSPDQHEAMFQSYAQPFSGAVQRLSPPKTGVDPAVHNQQLNPQPRAAGVVDRLKNFLTGGGSADPQAAAPSPGGAPSFEQWKAMKAQQSQ